MTDKDIINALECCFTNEDCSLCPLFRKCPTSFKLEQYALDLINRQQTEIERLKIENQSLRGAANSYKIHYEGLKSEIKKLIKAYRESQVSNLIAFVKSLCKDRVSNDPIVIAAQVELEEWLGDDNG